MRSFILLLKRIGLQRIIGVFIALMLILAASIYISKQPKTLDSSLQTKFDKGQYNETIPSIESWVSKYPTDQNAMELLGALYIQKAQAEPKIAREYYAKALKTLSGVVQINPKRDESFRLIGLAYFYRGDIKLAEKNFQKAYALSSGKNINSLLGFALIKESESNWAGAFSIYNEVLKADASSTSALLGLGRYNVQVRNPINAIQYSNKVISLANDDVTLAEAYKILGSANVIQRDFINAETNFQKSLAYKPNNVHTMTLYGESIVNSLLLLPTNQRDQAVQTVINTANKAISLSPNSIYGYTLLYKGYLLQNKYNEANNVGSKIVSLLPADSSLSDEQKKEYKEYYSGKITSATATVQDRANATTSVSSTSTIKSKKK